MKNFDLKKHLIENKLTRTSQLNEDEDLNNKKIGRQSYDLLDKYLPKMSEDQRFKLYQTIAQFLNKNGIKDLDSN